jgi:fructokinase
MTTRQNSRRKTEETDIDALNRRAVVLFGEILADMFPERSVLGGAPFNVARHLAAFGLNTLLVSRVGSDNLGREIIAAMAEAGMDARAVKIDGDRPTGRVRVHMDGGGHRFEILNEQAFDFIAPQEARSAAASCVPSMVYFGTLSQRGDVSRCALETLLEEARAPRFVDLNLRDPWYTEASIRFSLTQADILKINAEELMTLGRLFGLDGEDQEDRVRALMRRFDIGRAIVTCAEEGAWQVMNGGQWTATPLAFGQPDVVDTVGAGDGFSAVCILGAVSGWPLPETLNRADAFARAICGLRGAVPDSSDFYSPFLQEWTP